MRKISLITPVSVTIQKIEDCLAPSFEREFSVHEPVLGKLEHQRPDYVNELFVGDGDEHAVVADMPSVLHQYEGEEHDYILDQIPEPKIFVIRYSNMGLIRRIVAHLARGLEMDGALRKLQA